MEHGVAVDAGAEGLIPLHYIIGIGRNYAAHAAEQGAAVPERPMVFVKSPASLVLDGEAIEIPPACVDPTTGGEQTDYEAELAVVIGRAARDVPAERALEHVLGYCCANDVSARWWQRTGSGGQFTRGKSFDTFCPIGPEVVEASRVPDPSALIVRCRLNGVVMQEAPASQMIYGVGALIAELSRGATLPPGTVILTGTPSGVGFTRTPPVWLRPGDRVEVELEGPGLGKLTLRNPVR